MRKSFVRVSLLDFGKVQVLMAGSLLGAWTSIGNAAPIDWVDVGSPGNACEIQPLGCLGGVSYAYRISKYETTNSQYTEFLNGVATDDPYGLYAAEGYLGGMDGSYGGINRTGSPGSYSYSIKSGWENKPVTYTSFYDSIRFANWMHNGKGSGDTETGAYTITAAGVAGNAITRNAGATVFLTSEDEWYKAAYFDAVSSSFFDYPTGTDIPPTCSTPGSVPNTASCNMPNGVPATAGVVEVGSYSQSSSPTGTFNQTGNVGEWVEVIVALSKRGQQGASWTSGLGAALSSERGSYEPDFEHPAIGFRLAAIPEPSTALLLGVGLAGLGCDNERGGGAEMVKRIVLLVFLFVFGWSLGAGATSMITFTSTRDGNDEIYVMNADGSNQTRVTFETAVDTESSWSPDGNQLAFMSRRDGGAPKIYVMDADGGNPIRLTTHS